MDYTKQKEKLLDQLNAASGITFEITDSSYSEEETISKLKDMLSFYNMSDSKSKFYLNYLQGKLPLEDVSRSITRFHIDESAHICVYYIETKGCNAFSKEAIALLKSVLPSSKSNVLEINDHSILILKNVDDKFSTDELYAEASELVGVLETEAFTSAYISYNKVCNNFVCLPKEYQDVTVAMKIGRMFYDDEQIFNFANLGLGRMLYNLPKEEIIAFFDNNCAKEVFTSLDEETYNILKTFFENDLSIAETSRKLFMHRNTLIYKLDKFAATSGLDVRKFSDAQICQIGLMLSKMMD